MTPRQHFNKIVKRAWTINNHLEKLRQEAQALADECKVHYDEYDWRDYNYELAELNNVLEDLAGFDLEDAIPDKHKYEY